MAFVEYWDIELTRQQVDAMAGINQSMKARQSMISCQQRIAYAEYHLMAANDGWAEHLAEIKDLGPKEAIRLGDDEAGRKRMVKVGAHIHACIQSLHAIPDILAHVIYYGAALNHTAPMRKERDITAKTVVKSLAADASLATLAVELQSVFVNGEFAYLDALNNQGKHRSLVQTATLFELGPSKDGAITLELLKFTYDEVEYAKCLALPFLRKEYLRILKQMMKTGTTLFHILLLKLGRQHGYLFREVIEIPDE